MKKLTLTLAGYSLVRINRHAKRIIIMRINLLVFGFLIFITSIITWPLVLHFNTLIIDRYDGLLITWILNWNLHSIGTNANIFYPYHSTLAFSDYHFLNSLVSLPLFLVSHEPYS